MRMLPVRTTCREPQSSTNAKVFELLHFPWAWTCCSILEMLHQNSVELGGEKISEGQWEVPSQQRTTDRRTPSNTVTSDTYGLSFHSRISRDICQGPGSFRLTSGTIESSALQSYTFLFRHAGSRSDLHSYHVVKAQMKKDNEVPSLLLQAHVLSKHRYPGAQILLKATENMTVSTINISPNQLPVVSRVPILSFQQLCMGLKGRSAIPAFCRGSGRLTACRGTTAGMGHPLGDPNRAMSCCGTEARSITSLECSGAISAHCNFRLLGSSNSPCFSPGLTLSPRLEWWHDYGMLEPLIPRLRSSSHLSLLTGTIGARHYASLIFIETGFHHVAQPGLELLDSSCPPALVSQRAGITSMSHRTHSDVEMEFHPDGQAGLELLTSSDPPTSSSQNFVRKPLMGVLLQLKSVVMHKFLPTHTEFQWILVEFSDMEGEEKERHMDSLTKPHTICWNQNLLQMPKEGNGLLRNRVVKEPYPIPSYLRYFPVLDNREP
ncbi:LOW QUALITY PROTEIN: hypothetical protein AAY473_023497 [Plecturocebus cupreus]